MRCTIFFLALMFFGVALQAQDVDSLAYLLGEPQPVDTVQEAQATEGVDLNDIEFDTEDYDSEGETVAYVPPDSLAGTLDYKANKISVRKFDEEKWKTIAGSANYEETPPKKEEKPEEEKSKEERPSESGPWSGEIFRAISFTFIIAIVLALLYFLLRNTTFENKLRNRSSIDVKDLVTQVENIDDLDIQTLLQRTLAEGNLRLAVRLYYLGLLKKLNDVGFIAWKRNKTNRDYLSELFPKEYYFEEVKKLTLVYEQVWYGEHTITPEFFRTLSTRFETVDQKLNAVNTL